MLVEVFRGGWFSIVGWLLRFESRVPSLKLNNVESDLSTRSASDLRSNIRRFDAAKFHQVAFLFAECAGRPSQMCGSPFAQILRSYLFSSRFSSALSTYG